ncbi:uncharacterized protein K452DRAFT_303372 [Aplosporella prunicola CBS 121167]|uniref:Uncharacterized protein n=1 Tax=Aplosporella prunicola CBS 121167 TaxID=1176127 RepID=A0A6A6AUH1_9PEZI|nr:uncharacterized protein K452DRAFT_303372 [Aplosporella prunicola CBS 121167]KAF2135662.1 hypothetical protein K452DRAFT_303372 [Aplosporella prunicola CBS 121167]
MAYTGPCYNQASPHSHVGNHCYCDGDGLCYTNGPNTEPCDHPGDKLPECPYPA